MLERIGIGNVEIQLYVGANHSPSFATRRHRAIVYNDERVFKKDVEFACRQTTNLGNVKPITLRCKQGRERMATPIFPNGNSILPNGDI